MDIEEIYLIDHYKMKQKNRQLEMLLTKAMNIDDQILIDETKRGNFKYTLGILPLKCEEYKKFISYMNKSPFFPAKISSSKYNKGCDIHFVLK